MSELVDVGFPTEWTLDDLAMLPDDGHRYEIVDGGLYVSPPPGLPHQFAAQKLAVVLELAAPPDLAVMQCIGVGLDRTMFIPDVAVVSRSAVRGATVAKPADVRLAVEIVSPSSKIMDQLVKPVWYAEAGIPSFWRINSGHSRMAPSIQVYELDGRRYVEIVTIKLGERVELEHPFPVVLAPARLVP